ncbi:G-protein coupled receptor 83-like [Oppia nitens]|uniref:G-protein coupled receptor 83-like n=1 Tax=Oppia nitens TaxID=1686743 RepID=UPI0023DB51D0|nr:G-protein coupled receptor 83-like [Oppia nitens]
MDENFTSLINSKTSGLLLNTVNPLLIEYLKNVDHFDDDYQLKNTIKYFILMTLYILIFLTSIIGNLLVVKVIISGHTTCSLTNTLIANLAISDLLMTAVNIPTNIIRFVLDNWPFGQFMCVLVPLVQSTSVHCSSITMMFIAIERYRILVCNLHPTHRTYICGQTVSMSVILAIIWFASVIISIPHGFYNRLVSDHLLTRCRVVYPEPALVYRQRWTVLSFLSQYLIPILFTSLCYVRISLFLWRRKTIGVISEIHKTQMVRIKRRRIKMLVLVVTAFAICWFPLNVYHLLTDFDIIDYSLTIFFIVHCFAMSSVCYNPFIYCWLNKRFKEKVKKLLFCVSTHTRVSGDGQQNVVSLPMNTYFDVVDCVVAADEELQSDVGAVNESEFNNCRDN